MINYTTADQNNSYFRDAGHDSTPKHSIISIKEWTQKSSASLMTDEKDSSTPSAELSLKPVSEDAIQLSDEVEIKKRQYELLVNKLKNQLEKALKDYSLECDTLSQAEEIICNIADKYSFRVLGEVLTDIYIHCYDQQNMIAGICYSLERFDVSEISPWGQSIVIGLINHKSDLVKERVISLIENWGDDSLLPALKSIDISSVWMREYVNGVITYLEEKECIM